MRCFPLRPTAYLLVLVLALTGCATQWQLPRIDADQPEPAVAASHDPDLHALLTYYFSMDGQPLQALEQERQFYQAAAVDGRCDTARMRLGLVLLRLAERDLRFKESENAMRPCRLDPRLIGSNMQYLADLIHAQLRSRTTVQTRYQAVLQESTALKEENQELRRQVEGLKAIERSLQNRRLYERGGSSGTTGR
jgi:hypothetical protein